MSENRSDREERVRSQIDRAVGEVRKSPLFRGQSDSQIRERVATAVRNTERKNPSAMNQE